MQNLFCLYSYYSLNVNISLSVKKITGDYFDPACFLKKLRLLFTLPSGLKANITSVTCLEIKGARKNGGTAMYQTTTEGERQTAAEKADLTDGSQMWFRLWYSSDEIQHETWKWVQAQCSMSRVVHSFSPTFQTRSLLKGREEVGSNKFISGVR